MGIRVTWPVNMSLRDWVDTVTYDLTPYVIPFTLTDDNDWRTWASQVVAAPALAGNNPPNPYLYADWNDWAMRFCNAIEA